MTWTWEDVDRNIDRERERESNLDRCKIGKEDTEIKFFSLKIWYL